MRIAVHEAVNAVENPLGFALAARDEGECDFRSLMEVVKIALRDRHSVAAMAALDETLDHATLLLEASAGGEMKLEYGNCDDSGHGADLSGELSSEKAGRS